MAVTKKNILFKINKNNNFEGMTTFNYTVEEFN